MTAELAIAARLLATAAVTAIVADRVVPQIGPQDETREYIVFHRVDGVHHHHMHGPSGLVMVRVQLDIYAPTYLRSKVLAEKVRLCLDGFPQRAGETVQVGTDQVAIGMCHLDSDADGFDSPTGGSQRGRFRVIQDYIVGQYEDVPALTGA